MWSGRLSAVEPRSGRNAGREATGPSNSNRRQSKSGLRHACEGSSIQVIVPADQRLEQRAQAIIEKKQPGFRDQAVIAMQWLSGPANNIHLLTSLLNDPELDVRHAAYQVLKSWGMDAGTRDPLHW